MRQGAAVAMVGLLTIVVGAGSSSAQSTWSDKARINIDVGVQPSSSTFSGTTNNPVYLETATLTTNYNVPSGQFFDGGVIVRVSGGFGVGLGASGFTRSDPASISGTIPHPLLPNHPRPISGTSSSLEHHEIVGSIDAAYVLTASRLDVAVTAGPAFFTVNQDLVSNVTFTDVPPYNTVGFTGAVVTRADATGLGFNAGIDLGIKLSKYVGIGAILRYTKASVTFPLENSTAGVHTDVGGAHAGAGLRLYF
jgi:hypothetical protein